MTYGETWVDEMRFRRPRGRLGGWSGEGRMKWPISTLLFLVANRPKIPVSISATSFWPPSGGAEVFERPMTEVRLCITGRCDAIGWVFCVRLLDQA